MKDKFSNIWASYFYKVKATFVDSGSTAIYEALKLLNSKTVIVPTYTCHRILDTILKANCTPIIVDCDDSLQMDFNDIIYNDYADTIIVPHMFGIQSNIKEISKHTNLKIIEDCSQCMGLPKLGYYSDIVIASTGPSKYFPIGDNKDKGGGIIAYNEGNVEWFDKEDWIKKSCDNFNQIETKIKTRTEKAQEILDAGVDLIGKNLPNAWLRAVYIGKKPRKRECYVPLHKIYNKFDCPKTDSYEKYINWISIFE